MLVRGERTLKHAFLDMLVLVRQNLQWEPSSLIKPGGGTSIWLTERKNESAPHYALWMEEAWQVHCTALWIDTPNSSDFSELNACSTVWESGQWRIRFNEWRLPASYLSPWIITLHSIRLNHLLHWGFLGLEGVLQRLLPKDTLSREMQNPLEL